MTLLELKSNAYDVLFQIELRQGEIKNLIQQLQEINGKINQLSGQQNAEKINSLAKEQAGVIAKKKAKP